MPRFTCPHCRRGLTAPDGQAGTRVACPGCGGEVVVPGPRPAGVARAVPVAARPVTAPRVRPGPDDGRAEDVTGRAGRGQIHPLLLVAGGAVAACLLLTVVGAAVLVLGTGKRPPAASGEPARPAGPGRPDTEPPAPPVRVRLELPGAVVVNVGVTDRTGVNRVRLHLGGVLAGAPAGPLHALPVLCDEPDEATTVVRFDLAGPSPPIATSPPTSRADQLLCVFRDRAGEVIGLGVARHEQLGPGRTRVVAECRADVAVESVEVRPERPGTWRTLAGHRAAVSAVAFSRDGRHLASAAGDGTLRLWDLHAGRPVQEFGHHAGSINCLAVSPDGELIAGGSGGYEFRAGGQSILRSDDPVHLWSVADGRERRYGGQAAPVKRVEFSADGRWLVTGGGTIGPGPDGQVGSIGCAVRVWDVESDSEMFGATGLAEPVGAMAAHRRPRYLVSADRSGVRIWDVGARGPVETLPYTADPTAPEETRDVRVSPDGGSVVSLATRLDRDYVVRTWDWQTRRLIREVRGRLRHRVEKAALSADSRRAVLLTSEPDGGLYKTFVTACDAATGSVVFSEEGGYGSVGTGANRYGVLGAGTSLAVSYDGSFAAVGVADGSVRVVLLPVE